MPFGDINTQYYDIVEPQKCRVFQHGFRNALELPGYFNFFIEQVIISQNQINEDTF